MFQKFQVILKSILKQLNLLSYDETLSLTNLYLYVFMTITAFRLLFAGFTFKRDYIDFTVPDINIAVTLPAIFGLFNYMAKRTTNFKASSDVNKEDN